jgi:archaemetzincin
VTSTDAGSRASRRRARDRPGNRRATIGAVLSFAVACAVLAALFNAGEGAPPPPIVLDLPREPVPVVVRGASDRARRLSACAERLRAFQRPLPAPGPADWLTHHPEAGQTFKEYVECEPVTALGKRRIIYIQPLGEFDETQKEIVRLTAEFMSRYFGLSVTIRRPLSLASAPPVARRFRSTLNTTQILTTWVLDCVLAPRLPDDAAAFIAFTTADLWPGEGWNFVFGQASLSERIGVWSLFRQGDPHEDRATFRLVLLRTLKIATHEAGHMFSMQHCTAYLCNMCGCNSREEADRNPLALCCECMAKLCWATGADPLERYRALSAFCGENGLTTQGQIYEILATALELAAPETPESRATAVPAPAPDASPDRPAAIVHGAATRSSLGDP